MMKLDSVCISYYNEALYITNFFMYKTKQHHFKKNHKLQGNFLNI